MSVGRAWGKLYVAGEYGVVHPGGRAVLVAVDRAVEATAALTSDDDGGLLVSDRVPGGPLPWRRVDGAPVAARPAPEARHVLAAVAAVEEVVVARGLPRRGHTVEIASALDADDGRKLGLGSSAAVTVAVVRTLGDAYGLGLDDDAVLRVALAAQVRHDATGSGGDLAAAVHGGWLLYRSPDRAVLAGLVARGGAPALLADDAPVPTVHRLPAPAGLDLHVGWTGAPASSAALVRQALDGADDAVWDAFRPRSEAAVDALARALDAGDDDAALEALRAARRALVDLGAAAGVAVETPALRALADAADAAGGAGKSSGAGGGDCGIALLPAGTDAGPLHDRWRAAGVDPLPLAAAHPSPAADPRRTEEDR